jgi:hypothetical protein
MQTVDRAGFIQWIDGILLRFENGRVTVSNETECIAAKKELKKGRKIALTENGKIVSYMVPRKTGYYEVLK